MIFAPVVIPTLNRYKHFKNCLESLERCNNADKTEVFVALDYPPSDKYVEGWKAIDAYLKEKENNNKFGRLTVYRRETNYFFSGKGNAGTVLNELSQHFDNYIFSEDDNVFSPGFLDFINMGLEQFKYDKSVIAICGYSHYYKENSVDLKNYNTFRNTSYFSAWGYATWFDRQLSKQDNIVYCRDAFIDKEAMRRVKALPDSFKYMMKTLKSGRRFPSTDVMYTLRSRIYNLCTITPVQSLVYNVGYDDSGLHAIVGRDKTLYSEVKVDDSPFTEIRLAPDDISKAISDSIIKHFSYKGEVRPWMHLLCLFIKVIGYDRYIKLNHALRKLLRK